MGCTLSSPACDLVDPLPPRKRKGRSKYVSTAPAGVLSPQQGSMEHYRRMTFYLDDDGNEAQSHSDEPQSTSPAAAGLGESIDRCALSPLDEATNNTNEIDDLAVQNSLATESSMDNPAALFKFADLGSHDVNSPIGAPLGGAPIGYSPSRSQSFALTPTSILRRRSTNATSVSSAPDLSTCSPLDASTCADEMPPMPGYVQDDGRSLSASWQFGASTPKSPKQQHPQRRLRSVRFSHTQEVFNELPFRPPRRPSATASENGTK